jgi:hypothetical protein
MSSWLARLAIAAILAVGVANAVTAQPARADGKSGAPVVLTDNRTLQASLDRIEAGSELWRRAAETLRGIGRHVLLLTPDRVVVADTVGSQTYTAFDPTVLAEAAPVPRADSQVLTVVVVINLPLLQQVHGRTGPLGRDFDADLDRILIHEVYGHAFPYLLAGDLSGRCADPGPGEAATDACAIRRENAVRAELGLGRRADAGLNGLALGRNGTH